MTTAINNLAELDDVVVTGGGEDYEAPRDTSAPPPAAQYTFMRIDEQEGDTRQGRTVAKNGQGMAWWQFKLAIQGGPFDGRLVFDGCNTYVGDFRPSSSAADYLRASKSPARPTTIKTYEEAIARTFGPFNAVTDWEWRCKDCEDTFLVGAKNPKKAKKYSGKVGPIARTKDGAVDYEQPCPDCGVKVAAQSKIKRFVVTSSAPVVPQGSGGAAVELPPAEG